MSSFYYFYLMLLRVSRRSGAVLRRSFSGVTAVPQLETAERGWPMPVTRSIPEETPLNGRVAERRAVDFTEEEVLGSIPALGTPESMPSYHHEHMYSEENLLALYELYGEAALEGYKEIGEKFRETRGG